MTSNNITSDRIFRKTVAAVQVNAGLIRGYVDETAARVLPGFFQARANGNDAVAKRIV